MPGFEEYKEAKNSRNRNIEINNNNENKRRNIINNLNEINTEDKNNNILNTNPIDDLANNNLKKISRISPNMKAYYNNKQGVRLENIKEYDYDPTQLIEHLESRYQDDSEDAFMLRTNYHFTDYKVAREKARRYRKMIDDEGNFVAQYTRQHPYRYAWKRKLHAMDADTAFTNMGVEMANLSIADKGDVLARYAQREKIMKLRMKGMSEAAKVKAQSAKHGNYLVARGKLSCYLALKDQLNHFLNTEQLDNRQRRKLTSKLKSVNESIESAKADIIKNVPKSHEKWREANGLNKNFYNNKLRSIKQEYNPDFTLNSAILLSDLEEYQRTQNGYSWPKKTVFKNSAQNGGAFISKAEKENNEWNEKYDNASQKVKNEMEQEALKRFKNIPLPKASDLEGSGARKYVTANLRDYYDLTKRALPYYKHILESEGANPIREMIVADSELVARINYLAAVDQYIDFKLRRDHYIQYDKDNGGFKLEQDVNHKYARINRGQWRRPLRKYGFDDQNRDQTAMMFRRLTAAYRTYETNKDIPASQIIHPVQNLNQGLYENPPIILDNQNIINFEKADQKDKPSIRADHSNEPLIQVDNKENNKEDNKEDLLIIKKEPNENIHKDNEDNEDNEEKKEPVNNIIEVPSVEQIEEGKEIVDSIINLSKNENENNVEDKKEEDKEENKEENLNKIEDEEEAKEETKEEAKEENKEENFNKIAEEAKEENLNKIEDEEEVKEESLNQIVIDKKDEEVNEIVEEKNGLVHVWEGKNHYIYTKEQADRYEEFHKKQPRITRRVFNAHVLYMNFMDIKLNKEYDALFKKGSLFPATNDNTIDRCLQANMKPVLFDDNGQPITKVDKENHEWNLKWLNTFVGNIDEEMDEKTREEMLKSYFPHIYDDMEYLSNALAKYSEKPDGITTNMEAFFESLLDNPEELKKFQEMCVRGLSVDRMKKFIPSVKAFTDSNKKFQNWSDIIDTTSNVFMTYLRKKYGIIIEKKDIRSGVEDEEARKKSEATTRSAYDGLLGYINSLYLTNKKVLNGNTSYEYGLTKEEKDKLEKEKPIPIVNQYINEYKKMQPNLSDKAINILKAKTYISEMSKCPQYQEKMKIALAEFKGSGKSASLDKVAAYIMRPVKFDENYKPIGKTSNANHDRNMDWLGAWEDIKEYTEEDAKKDLAKKNKVKVSDIQLTKEDIENIAKENKNRQAKKDRALRTRKSRIETEVKSMQKDFPLPPAPKSDNLSKNDLKDYQAELEKYTKQREEEERKQKEEEEKKKAEEARAAWEADRVNHRTWVIDVPGQPGKPAVLYTQEDFDAYVTEHGENPPWSVGDEKEPAVPEVPEEGHYEYEEGYRDGDFHYP